MPKLKVTIRCALDAGCDAELVQQGDGYMLCPKCGKRYAPIAKYVCVEAPTEQGINYEAYIEGTLIP